MMMDDFHPLLQLGVEWWTNNFGHPNPKKIFFKNCKSGNDSDLMKTICWAKF
jgi:hypothetical protein